MNKLILCAPKSDLHQNVRVFQKLIGCLRDICCLKLMRLFQRNSTQFKNIAKVQKIYKKFSKIHRLRQKFSEGQNNKYLIQFNSCENNIRASQSKASSNLNKS